MSWLSPTPLEKYQHHMRIKGKFLGDLSCEVRLKKLHTDFLHCLLRQKGRSKLAITAYDLEVEWSWTKEEIEREIESRRKPDGDYEDYGKQRLRSHHWPQT